MKPLAVHGGAAEALFWACAAGWAIFELALALRTRGSGGRDRSFVPLTLSVLAGLALGVLVARRAGDLARAGLVAGGGRTGGVRPRPGVATMGRPRARAVLQVHGRGAGGSSSRRYGAVSLDSPSQLHRSPDD